MASGIHTTIKTGTPSLPPIAIILYCVKCRAKKAVSIFQRVAMKNGKPAIKAKCPTCGTGMYKIGNLQDSDLTTPDINLIKKQPSLRSYLESLLHR